MPVRIEVYDPALCCPTGVCGPAVDPVLPRFAADLEHLRRLGVEVVRRSLAHEPSAFAASDTVRRTLERDGVAGLPLVLADGRVVAKGRYPARAELEQAAGVGASAPSRTVDVELLALDLDTCDRCCGTDASLDAAVEQAAAVLRAEGVALRVTKTVVSSVAQAQALRFASSPTVRVGGRDVAVETRESACGPCGDLAGTDVACRVWVHEGEEHAVAPVPMLVDAILAHARRADAPPAPAAPFVVPENVRRFLEGVASREAAAPPVAAACCAPVPRHEKPRVGKGGCC